MMMFGGGRPACPAGRRRRAAPRRLRRRRRRAAGAGRSAGDRAAHRRRLGLRRASIPSSIQADNGAGLTKGIIGLVNKGQPRKPDDWGALRAWAWGASRGLDYLETDKAVDAKQVGIEGVSRYGKAALVTMAFDQRFAVVLVGSSGEGGAKLHRRNWGEAVENLTGSGEYHWMAGNFLKYGAAEATFGSKNAGDLPVDAHELIALCAPRLDVHQLRRPGEGRREVARSAGQLHGRRRRAAGLPAARREGPRRSDDYKTEKMPPVNAGLLDGQLAWRQHDGGHTDAPELEVLHPVGGQASLQRTRRRRRSIARRRRAADRPRTSTASAPRAAARQSRKAGPHRRLLRRRLHHPPLGRDRLSATSWRNWKQNFFGWNAADFGWGADRIENILWRLENGELDGVNPKVIVAARRHQQRRQRSPADDAEGRRHQRRGITRDRRRHAGEGARRDDHPRPASSRATTTWR